MTDLYLRFDTREAALSALDPLGMVADGELLTGSHDYALWEVGEIPDRDGWHINLRVIKEAFDMASLEPYQVNPAQPVCVWA